MTSTPAASVRGLQAVDTAAVSGTAAMSGTAAVNGAAAISGEDAAARTQDSHTAEIDVAAVCNGSVRIH